MAVQSPSEKQTSGTALATVFMRALAANDPREGIRGNDSLAEIFLDEEQKKPLKVPGLRAWVMKNRVTPGAYEFMLARTTFFDRIVKQALKDNLSQIVFLGAGYDSRPYRFTEFIQDTRIFELDAEPTQRRKRDCLEKAGIPISSQISFVPIDFVTDDLGYKLNKAGFCSDQKTLYVWEGVTYYLSREVVDNMLEFVRLNSPSGSGSSICFDYASISAKALSGAKELRQHMQSRHADEPTKFGIQAGTIKEFLVRRGFAVVEHLTADEMNERYFSGLGYSDFGKVPELFCLVHAKVMEK